jgi:hypothetical protein
MRAASSFKAVVRENSEISRSKQVQLIFDRWVIKATHNPLRTRVIADGVISSLDID